MALLQRTSFAGGWVPNADKVNAPVNALLRMDNCVLDQLGALTLRPGSTKVNSSPLADSDVHSLFTAILSGTRYRMYGAGNEVYANGSALTAMSGSGDVSFGSHLGQILFARGSTTKKYDGTTLRTWGVPMTGAAPSIAGAASDSKVFASFDIGESPAFSADEGIITFEVGQDGTINGALGLDQDVASNRGSITKQFVSVQDFTVYDGGTVGTDSDLLQIWVYASDPAQLLSVTLMIDVNPSSTNLFQDDYYIHNFVPGDANPIGATDNTVITPSLSSQSTVGRRVRGDIPATGVAVPRSDFSPAKPISNSGWNKLQVRRGDMTRNGSTSGKDWTTVHAVRLVVFQARPITVEFDTLSMIGNPLAGSYKWLYVLAYNSGTYVGLSAPSPLSAAFQIQAQGGTVTVPADSARDPQVNEIWVYRMGGVMDAFYRTGVVTGVSGTGAVTVNDLLSDIDAMTVGLKVQTDNAPPPNGIISLTGPYFDRTFVLTPTTLWPSRRINPDSFATGQAITIAGVDETPYWVRKSLGGLYVGTSKDIYLIEGTGAELPDGSVDFTKRPLNVDHPPVNDGVAMDGNVIIYFSADGWRTLSGSGSLLLTGETSQLYYGETRHGVSPVNVLGRLRATISNGQFAAITPEGAASTSSSVVYRHAPLRATWYRHLYPTALRCVYHEPDGTLLASDTSGTVWQFDAGDTLGDAGNPIPVTVWTKCDDDGQPFNRKDPLDLRVQFGSDGLTLNLSYFTDASDTAAYVGTAALSGIAASSNTLVSVAASRLVQLRLTGSFFLWTLVSWAVQYVALPVPMFGQIPRTNFGDPRLKRLSGFQFRLCTRGVPRLLTPILDGVAQAGLSVTSHPDEALDVTYQFPTPTVAVEVGLLVDGDIELYGWTPLVTDRRPIGLKMFDSGPIDIGDRELVWLRRIDFKVNAEGPLTIAAYMDGRLLSTLTLPVRIGVDTIIPVDVPRGTKGRQPRLVVTSTAPFYPYWLKVIERVTGYGTEKTIKTVPLAVTGGTP